MNLFFKYLNHLNHFPYVLFVTCQDCFVSLLYDVRQMFVFVYKLLSPSIDPCFINGL